MRVAKVAYSLPAEEEWKAVLFKNSKSISTEMPLQIILKQ